MQSSINVTNHLDPEMLGTVDGSKYHYRLNRMGQRSFITNGKWYTSVFRILTNITMKRLNIEALEQRGKHYFQMQGIVGVCPKVNNRWLYL